MTTKKLVGFIDLLGTKESSKISENEYYSAIISLHNTMERSKKLLTNGYIIKGFSDCAFLALNADETAICFLKLLRESLFAEGYYFKCSIIYAQFDIKISGSNKEAFSSVIFGPQSVDAYIMHERFKGIGYVVDSKLNKLEKIKNELVPTIYISHNGKSIIFKKCWDIKFGSTYVGNENYLWEKKNRKLIKGMENHSAELNINRFLKSFVIAKTKNNSYAKYYISTLISLINSSDFSCVSYSDEDGFMGMPVIFHKIFLDKSFEKNISNVPGSEILHFAALDKLYRDISHTEANKGEFDIVKNKLAIIIAKKKKIINFMGKVPSFIFKSNFKSDFLERVANFELGYN